MSLSYLTDTRIIKKEHTIISVQKATIFGKAIVLGTLQTTYPKTLARFIIAIFFLLRGPPPFPAFLRNGRTKILETFRIDGPRVVEQKSS
jgi:hypothetical protein